MQAKGSKADKNEEEVGEEGEEEVEVDIDKIVDDGEDELVGTKEDVDLERGVLPPDLQDFVEVIGMEHSDAQVYKSLFMPSLAKDSKGKADEDMANMTAALRTKLAELEDRKIQGFEEATKAIDWEKVEAKRPYASISSSSSSSSSTSRMNAEEFCLTYVIGCGIDLPLQTKKQLELWRPDTETEALYLLKCAWGDDNDEIPPSSSSSSLLFLDLKNILLILPKNTKIPLNKGDFVFILEWEVVLGFLGLSLRSFCLWCGVIFWFCFSCYFPNLERVVNSSVVLPSL
jgi:hypothetical protein